MAPRLRDMLLAGVMLAVSGGGALADIPNRLLKVGVLTDMSGPFASQAGQGSFVAAQMAAEDFAKEAGDLKVEIVAADHQNKPDVGSAIVRRWIDQENVNTVVDLPNSGVALAISALLDDRNIPTMASGTATSDMTGKFCKKTTVQWAHDTWALGNGMGKAVTKAGGKKWFFIAYDYALGQALERDTSEAVKKAGGTVVGSVKHPLGTTDFSSYILQAQSSGADVIALGGTGVDAINAIKQMGEFGVIQKGMQLAALFIQISDVQAIGLDQAKGLIVTESFYWDLNDRTREWSRRFSARMNGKMPTVNHASTYSATLAYLRAAKAADSVQGDKIVAQMQKMTFDDPTYGKVTVRPDGRAVHEMFVFKVKDPSQSKSKDDVYDLLETIPAEEAFRPIKDGGCPLIK
ncbi:ABC transporter substrate-binding protein [Enterovirga sp. DB1703]|uniref:ABC transporter substrate-binding protein n=2 Tax=Enterovirga aerilata TaxID=2730920 RepID=A0A849IGW1_9HYPH|nr:ABC transporter substrate-binding protein [Enterovirga sp. DB1703]